MIYMIYIYIIYIYMINIWGCVKIRVWIDGMDWPVGSGYGSAVNFDSQPYIYIYVCMITYIYIYQYVLNTEDIQWFGFVGNKTAGNHCFCE